MPSTIEYEPTQQETCWTDYSLLQEHQAAGTWNAECNRAAIRILAEAGLAPQVGVQPLHLMVADVELGRHRITMSRDADSIRILLRGGPTKCVLDADARGPLASELAHLMSTIVSANARTQMPEYMKMAAWRLAKRRSK